MEIKSILSLALGLVSGMMFGIVFSKYEYYSSFYDARMQSYARQPVGDAFRRDQSRVSSLLRHQGKNASVVDSAKPVHSSDKPLQYAIGGKSFYLKFDNPDSLPTKSQRELQKYGQLSEISRWQTFDPLYDAEKLKSLISVFCVIVAGASHVNQHGKTASQSWTQHCNDYVILSSIDNEKYKAKSVLAQAKTAWERTRDSFRYALKYHPDHDWYVKVDHDTFLVMENIRYMLLTHQTSLPGFAGHVIQTNEQQGSVIALGKPTLTLASSMLANCQGLYGGKDDAKELEACLKPIGIKVGTDGRDGQGVNRLQMVQAKPNLPLNARKMVDWSWRYITNPDKMGQEDCCHDYAISFHQVSHNGLYLMEYVVYHMRPFGIGTYMCPAVEEGGNGDQSVGHPRDQDQKK